jgi:hypothetical protein
MSKAARAVARCVFCVRQDVEQHHVGGRNHVAWFTMPLCRTHHAQVHALLRSVGVNLEYTSDPQERYRRALQALAIAQWMLLEALKDSDDKSLKKKRPKPRRRKD